MSRTACVLKLGRRVGQAFVRMCAAERGADPWAMRVSQENMELFQSQVCATHARLPCHALERLVRRTLVQKVEGSGATDPVLVRRPLLHTARCHSELSQVPGRARQDPYLAKEPFWVHATTAPEQGGLLLARPRCAAILDPRYHQVRLPPPHRCKPARAPPLGTTPRNPLSVARRADTMFVRALACIPYSQRSWNG